MDILRSIGMSFLMFSKVPMPIIEWKKENMKYMLAFLPVIGAFIGGVMYLWMLLCDWLMFSPFIYAAGLTVIPVFISGGIHLDGYCDTIDALSSHASMEKKQQILKDSNSGAFAIIYTAVFFVMYYGFSVEVPMDYKAVIAMGAIQMLSRALGSFSGLLIPSSGSKGLLSMFSESASKKAIAVVVFWALGSMALGLFTSPWLVLAFFIVFMLCFIYIYFMSKKQFGGMSGDLAGYINTLSQLFMVMAYVAVMHLI